ncbi:MAG: AraC family transcriptional regulator [Saprospiraceae bacterium]
MPKKLLQYKGPYGEQINPVSDEWIDYEPLKKRSAVYNYEITEHLHTDLMQIFLITAGSGFLLSEGKKIALEAPCVLIIPNNTLHGFVFQSNVQGDVFNFTNTFFEKSLLDAKKILLKFNQLQYLIFDKKTNVFHEILTLKDNLIKELTTFRIKKNYAVKLYFQLLLLHLYRTNQEKPLQISPTENRTLVYFHAFQKLIKKNIYQTKNIQEYAMELNISTVHLNRICQALVQKSALQVVHEYLLIEAKKHLLGTSNSIAEISYFLGFKDPSHFSKFFRKIMGMSPRDFRKQRLTV